jgi:alkanesulfonate monooxygenase SsuD/methylene tetrahydromethanopterin reductase-like flavin-dependent oxidoreductase (luciferase family)
MRYGIVIPFIEIRVIEIRAFAELAREAEAAGWDGVFVPDGVPGTDPWVILAAMAMRTEHIRLGTMLTPVSRRRPWKLASETATLDNLSNGRVILPVGLGAIDAGFEQFGEETDRKVRAELLDEGLEVMTGLWSQKPFHYDGKHYHVRSNWNAPSLQQPRIPIWVTGVWPPHMKSMRRALRYDGLLPNVIDEKGKHREITPDDLRAIQQFVREQRPDGTLYDIVLEGETPGDDTDKARAIVRPLAEAGATWWLESMWWDNITIEIVRKRIQQGPPRID